MLQLQQVVSSGFATQGARSTSRLRAYGTRVKVLYILHISTSLVANEHSGQDNTSPECSTGAVPNIIHGNLIDHLGPYEGTWIGTIAC